MCLPLHKISLSWLKCTCQAIYLLFPPKLTFPAIHNFIGNTIIIQNCITNLYNIIKYTALLVNKLWKLFIGVLYKCFVTFVLLMFKVFKVCFRSIQVIYNNYSLWCKFVGKNIYLTYHKF